MPRKTLAYRQGEAALANMNQLHDLAAEARKLEGNSAANATYAHQAESLRRWAATTAKAGLPLPDWYQNNRAWLRTIGAA